MLLRSVSHIRAYYAARARFLHTDSSSTAGPSSSSFASSFWEQSREYRDLVHSLLGSRNSFSPSQTWNAYNEVSRILDSGGEPIPLAVHQSVLRRCLPHSYRLRNEPRPHNPKLGTTEIRSPYRAQQRADLIIANMRKSGFTPSLDDYHLLLNHYAAIGNYIGSMGLLHTMVEEGTRPTEQTFELVLLALGRKLSITYPWSAVRRSVVEAVARDTEILIRRMRDAGVQQTPKILDLCVRLIGETKGLPALKHLLRTTYGIDLEQPDAVAEEFAHSFQNLIEAAKSQGSPPPALPVFSTHTLNTVLEVIGHSDKGSLGPLLSAFEVLTNPLPPISVPQSAYGYDDADDDESYFPTSAHSPATFSVTTANPPIPNTATYVSLIRYACQKRQTHKSLVFGKHFLVQAIEAELRDADDLQRRIGDILRPGLALGNDDIHITGLTASRIRALPTPRVHVNAYMFKAIYRLADYTTQPALLTWAQYHQRGIIESKKQRKVFLETLAAALETVEDEDPQIPKSYPWSTTFSSNDPSLPVRIPTSFSIDRHITALAQQISELETHLNHAVNTRTKLRSLVKRVARHHIRRGELRLRLPHTIDKIENKRKAEDWTDQKYRDEVADEMMRKHASWVKKQGKWPEKIPPPRTQDVKVAEND